MEKTNMGNQTPLEISRFISGDYAKAIYRSPNQYFDSDFNEKRGKFILEETKIHRTDKNISIPGKLESEDQIHGVGIIVDLPNFIDKAIAKFMHHRPKGKINISIYKVLDRKEETSEQEPSKMWQAASLGALAIREQTIS